MRHVVEAIGRVHSPYRQKFAIPRQPGLVSSAFGKLEFYSPYANPECFRGIEEFDYLWVNFIFHETQAQGWKPLVRPPRLGGNLKKGVFATRSTFRPNALGLSVVKLEEVRVVKGQTELWVSGLDLLDGTPIVDIKPYLAYADALPNASGGFADTRPSLHLQIEFTDHALSTLEVHKRDYPHLKQLIIEVLQQDPRPAYKTSATEMQTYGMHLYHFNIKWCVLDGVHRVTEIHAGATE
ncbi:MAG: tRNA-Thr(GGU) m(6)t(6)A37 methyltransferase TsaA [Idiomarinaceae bacterium HL-53]|nr:MAG: tRNA-Thr(GGU) m(6)t(6)A37 methyltransferase TsaA [Idiomarinaceae bacterium HL-53]CUS48827.1 tRNA-Thr(GGU) m(6)t(6)A37 methyltransferase TsaA [Idiomarinaceae bacterium HL-53]